MDPFFPGNATPVTEIKEQNGEKAIKIKRSISIPVGESEAMALLQTHGYNERDPNNNSLVTLV